MEKIICLNKTSLTYDESRVQKIYVKVLQDYAIAFYDIQKHIENKLSK